MQIVVIPPSKIELIVVLRTIKRLGRRILTVLPLAFLRRFLFGVRTLIILTI
jgi:hypothetical protein